MSKVLIVGATQGTSRELAAEYVRRGADVTITGRELERAENYPYPGSTTLTAVIHPAVIEDTPFWAGKEAMIAPVRNATITGRLGVMRDIVEGCLFLLENPLANGVDLRLDGGRA